MQATKAVKQNKWQALWRRLNRRTPFWKQRADDRVDSSSERGGSLIGDVVGIVMMLPIGAIALAFVAQFLIGPIFFSPGFFTVGLADPIGRGLASVCAATGQCDLRYLLGGTVVASVILLMIALAVIWPTSGEVVDDTDTIDAVLDATSALDERIVHLRADLVVAGVLKLSPEEQADIPPAAQPLPYVRPAVTLASQQAAMHLALDLTANKNTPAIRQAMAALALENERLTLEVNQHRAARGFEPLPTVEQ